MREVKLYSEVTDGSFLLQEYHPQRERDTSKYYLLDVKSVSNAELAAMARVTRWMVDLEQGDAKVVTVVQYLSPLDWKRVVEVKIQK